MKQRYTIVAHCFDKRGNLLSCATNNYEKTHPLQKFFADKVGHHEKIYLHAEIAAILRAKDRQIHHIRIFRYGANGKTLLAKPCPICIEAIKAFGIKEVTYSTTNGYIRHDLTTNPIP
jgi:tRNA(Arg) A34 adenosine deaminase TadA